MKPNWHVMAARVQAMYPHWSWSQVCSHLAKRRTPHLKRPSVVVYTAKLEQLKLW